jgi:hypothetical protein
MWGSISRKTGGIRGSSGLTKDNALLNYVGQMSRRWDEAKEVARAEITPEGWLPEPKQCHANVTRWVEENPKHQAVRVWLILDMRNPIVTLLGHPPCIDLLAHFVVANELGESIDITPAEAPYGTPNVYPFLKHDGSEEEYQAIVEGRSICRIRLHWDDDSEPFSRPILPPHIGNGRRPAMKSRNISHGNGPAGRTTSASKLREPKPPLR